MGHGRGAQRLVLFGADHRLLALIILEWGLRRFGCLFIPTPCVCSGIKGAGRPLDVFPNTAAKVHPIDLLPIYQGLGPALGISIVWG